MGKKEERPAQRLADLPADFDRKVITMPDNRRGCVSTLRLCKSDFAPIARRGFAGYFAMRDILQGRPRSQLIMDIMERGGDCLLVETRSGRAQPGERKVRILHAWRDRDYVVVHMEPWKEDE